MAPKLVVFGAGGHARVVLEILRMTDEFEIVGLLDRGETGRVYLDGVMALGTDERLVELRKEGVTHYFIAVGSVGSLSPRKRLYDLAAAQQMEAVRALHPRAIISPFAKVGPGTAVLAGAIVNPGASVGENVIINTGAIVEHDCKISDHSHISTGALLCGGVRVGEEAHVGAGATIRQNCSVGRGAVVGAGAVVIKDVPDCVTVVGVPAHDITTKVETSFG